MNMLSHVFFVYFKEHLKKIINHFFYTPNLPIRKPVKLIMRKIIIKNKFNDALFVIGPILFAFILKKYTIP